MSLVMGLRKKPFPNSGLPRVPATCWCRALSVTFSTSWSMVRGQHAVRSMTVPASSAKQFHVRAFYPIRSRVAITAPAGPQTFLQVGRARPSRWPPVPTSPPLVQRCPRSRVRLRRRFDASVHGFSATVLSRPP